MKMHEVIRNLTHDKKDAPCHIYNLDFIYNKGDRSSCHRKLYPYDIYGGCIGCRDSNSKDWSINKYENT